MYSTAMKDLTGPILDFQNLAKLLAKRWRDYAVDRKKKDCRKVLGLLQRAVSESAALPGESTSSTVPKDEEGGEEIAAHQHAGGDYEGEFDWSKLGFETNDPTAEINGMGFLGLLDFASFVQRDTESFNKVPISVLSKLNIDGAGTTRQTEPSEMSHRKNLRGRHLPSLRSILIILSSRYPRSNIFPPNRQRTNPRPGRSLSTALSSMAAHPLRSRKIIPPPLA